MPVTRHTFHGSNLRISRAPPHLCRWRVYWCLLRASGVNLLRRSKQWSAVDPGRSAAGIAESMDPNQRRYRTTNSGSLLGSPGETGVCLTLGTVYGVDGLKTGGGGGGGAGT